MTINLGIIDYLMLYLGQMDRRESRRTSFWLFMYLGQMDRRKSRRKSFLGGGVSDIRNTKKQKKKKKAL